MPDGIIISDGALDFSGGVDTLKTTTVASQANPNGLGRNQLAFLDNATVRDGGITQRWGWIDKGRIRAGDAIYQGGMFYEPVSDAFPYLILSIGGQLMAVNVDNPSAPVILNPSDPNPPTVDQAFFVQGEQYAIIQAGDNVTLPFFWDGTTLRRSHGITGNLSGPLINEIPPATAMDYFMNRIWYAQGRLYSAGDIVGGSTTVLNVTENPLAIGGDGFTVPTQAGNIRALKHSSQLDTTLGQGDLYIGTPKAIYALTVPVTRASWIASTEPLQRVVQLVNGPVNDRSVVQVNGDLFYQSREPSIRSLFASIRYFNQWGNRTIAANEQRVLNFNNRALLRFATGIQFDNRMLQSALPQTVPQGVIHKAIIPLDFLPLGSFESTTNPVWEGMYEGLDIYQLFEADFGGLQRAFAVVRNQTDASYHLWELTNFSKTDANDSRVTWLIESPAFTWGKEMSLKQLVGGDIWADRLSGDVIFKLEYRVDSDACWRLWWEWQQCSARNTCEDVSNPICYPAGPLPEGFRSTMTLPKPKTVCVSSTRRPSDLGYQFQVRLTIKGWCRIRGILLHAVPVERKLYQGQVC